MSLNVQGSLAVRVFTPSSKVLGSIPNVRRLPVGLCRHPGGFEEPLPAQ